MDAVLGKFSFWMQVKCTAEIKLGKESRRNKSVVSTCHMLSLENTYIAKIFVSYREVNIKANNWTDILDDELSRLGSAYNWTEKFMNINKCYATLENAQRGTHNYNDLPK